MDSDQPKTDIKATKTQTLLDRNSKISVTESVIKEIFTRFSSDGRSLSFNDISRLVSEVLKANGLPSIVPTELIPKLASEMSLEMENDLSIDFTEFKSFCLYFNNDPINFFLENTKKLFNQPMETFSKTAVLISFLLPKIPDDAKTNDPVLNELKTELVQQLKTMEFDHFQIFPFLFARTRRIDFFTIFESEDVRTLFLEKAKETEIILNDKKVKIINYASQELPRRLNQNTAAISGVAAKGLVLGKTAVNRAHSLADEYGVTKRINSFSESARKLAVDIDKGTGFSEKTQAIGDSFNNLTRQTSEKAKEVDEAVGLSAGVGQARDGLAVGLNSLKETEVVKTGLYYLSGVYSSIAMGLSGIKEDALELAETELLETPEIEKSQWKEDAKKEDPELVESTPNEDCIELSAVDQSTN